MVLTSYPAQSVHETIGIEFGGNNDDVVLIEEANANDGAQDETEKTRIAIISQRKLMSFLESLPCKGIMY